MQEVAPDQWGNFLFVYSLINRHQYCIVSKINIDTKLGKKYNRYIRKNFRKQFAI